MFLGLTEYLRVRAEVSKLVKKEVAGDLEKWKFKKYRDIRGWVAVGMVHRRIVWVFQRLILLQLCKANISISDYIVLPNG